MLAMPRSDGDVINPYMAKRSATNKAAWMRLRPVAAWAIKAQNNNPWQIGIKIAVWMIKPNTLRFDSTGGRIVPTVASSQR